MIHYAFRTREVTADQVASVSVEDRSVDVQSTGSISMTAQDTLLVLHFTDGSQLSPSVPQQLANEFRREVLEWPRATTK